jgi:glycerate dehydrogenase
MSFMQKLLITTTLKHADPEVIQQALAGLAEVMSLPESGPERQAALETADALLMLNPRTDLAAEEWQLLRRARVVQILTAGADHVPFQLMPPQIALYTIPGAYAEPMAEHVLAMALALAKHLFPQHNKLAHGEIDQQRLNRMVKGSVCAIIGYGGIGAATARLLHPLGVRICAINRHGRGYSLCECAATPADLEAVLRRSDIVVLCCPLTRATRGLIDEKALSWMKADAMLINVARGEIIDEAALYHHLQAHPSFGAGIDAWWVEPFRAGSFRTDHPFLELPNVVGSPHNSAMVPQAWQLAVHQAVDNLRCVLGGARGRGLIDRNDYL